ncbi:MAG: hypothetical protein F9K40_08915, partial [Kofleriaceae bacterium]
MAIYAYPLPLSDTEEDYPDHRIVYLKLSLTITGWTRNEEIPSAGSLPTGTDRFGADVWDRVTNVSGITAYLPCLSAIAQIAVYPRRPEGTLPDDYPFIVDFEPKKRELYETVTDTKEVLSGSNENTNIRKGHTSTHSVEGSVTAKTSIPLVGGADVTASAGYRRESVDIKTTDESTERRETAGRSTQLSQMYQLFNGYHAGTNRAVFVILPRPHTQTDAEQVEANLIGGERRLEGMQDIFLVVQTPRSADGLCVEAWLDTSHKEVAALGLITVGDD